MKTLLIIGLTGAICFGDLRTTMSAEEPDKVKEEFQQLQLTLLIKSAELAKQCYDLEVQQSVMNPSDSSRHDLALERLRLEHELAQLLVSNAKSEITKRAFNEQHFRLSSELTKISKTAYDVAISLNEKLPNATSVPEINRLRLVWEVAALQAALTKWKGDSEPDKRP